MNARRSSRRGVALLFAVACLSLLVLVFGSMFRLGFAERGQARREERRVRALWLAESGLERAWAKLSAHPEYRGETWELSAETLGGPEAAALLVTVEPIDDRYRVTSRADVPRSGSSRVRQTRVATFACRKTPLPLTGDTP